MFQEGQSEKKAWDRQRASKAGFVPPIVSVDCQRITRRYDPENRSLRDYRHTPITLVGLEPSAWGEGGCNSHALERDVTVISSEICSTASLGSVKWRHFGWEESTCNDCSGCAVRSWVRISLQARILWSFFLCLCCPLRRADPVTRDPNPSS
jgi:hypothetical protein